MRLQPEHFIFPNNIFSSLSCESYQWHRNNSWHTPASSWTWTRYNHRSHTFVTFQLASGGKWRAVQLFYFAVAVHAEIRVQWAVTDSSKWPASLLAFYFRMWPDQSVLAGQQTGSRKPVTDRDNGWQPGKWSSALYTTTPHWASTCLRKIPKKACVCVCVCPLLLLAKWNRILACSVQAECGSPAGCQK